ncbi:MAG: NifU family protein [Terracidiphilus sp.]
MENSGSFQDQVKELGRLIAQFDRMPEGTQKTACKELVQLLMDVHGAGLERMMEFVFESGDSGPAIIEKLGQDPVVGGLLLLYSLHPDDLETRVRKAIDRMRPRLRKLAASVELAGIDDGAVQVRVTKTGHSCGSSANDMKAIVEDGVYELAPDVASLEVLGLEEAPSSGFVALDSLLAHDLVAAAPGGRSFDARHGLRTEGAD